VRAARRDNNEPAIRARAEALGFLWLENNASTKGRPDACLLRNGQTLWCEVKVPGEPYTPAQMREFPRLVAKGVPIYVLETTWDVDRLNTGTLQAWAAESVDKVWSAAGGRKKQRPHRPGVDRARTLAEGCAMPGCATSRATGDAFCLKHHHP
jgi:hypothetical protein